MHADGVWQAVEAVFNKNMATTGKYFETWTLNLSTIETVSAVFHINNKEAKRGLKLNFNDETCPFAPNPNTSE